MLRAIIVLLLALLWSTGAQAGTIRLEDCRISAGKGLPSLKARCGTLRRPLDPEDVDKGEIDLRVAVVAALNLTPEPDPFVPIAGGPGQGSAQYYAAYAAAFEDVRRDRDIVLVDQRGTGESARMDCPVDEALVEGRYSAEETIRFSNECMDALPFDPRYFTTSVAVTDLEAVRLALGYPSFNLYGVSYGSRVAQHYARRYPGSTRTVILDGVAPPQISLGPEIATESQRAVDRALARCAGDAACEARFPGIRDVFRDVVNALRQQPVAIVVPDPNSGQPVEIQFGHAELAVAIRLLAYHPKSIALLPLLIDEAGRGNFVPLGSQYRMTMLAMADMLALGMHNSIVCTEDVPFYDAASIDRDTIDATYMGALQLESLEAICSVWPQGAIDADFKAPLSTDLPVLLLSGDADPITPPRYATLAAVELSNARHLVGKHQGHGQIAVGCMPRLAAEFVDNADPDGLDAGCLERSFVMPFFMDFLGPMP
ncbi:MAG: alpha/beta hydrolase [Gammaproteobacteria bacterium]|nr:alpha/beta hydrolase [Gammaproteobacteria bacterium]